MQLIKVRQKPLETFDERLAAKKEKQKSVEVAKMVPLSVNYDELNNPTIISSALIRQKENSQLQQVSVEMLDSSIV